MSNKVVTNHTINGMNVKDLSANEMIGIIRTAEDNIKTLEALETESSAVTKTIKAEQAFIKDVVKHLDAKK